jgi:chromosome segregation ATPase
VPPGSESRAALLAFARELGDQRARLEAERRAVEAKLAAQDATVDQAARQLQQARTDREHAAVELHHVREQLAAVENADAGIVAFVSRLGSQLRGGGPDPGAGPGRGVGGPPDPVNGPRR